MADTFPMPSNSSTGTNYLKHDGNKSTGFKPNLRDFDEVRTYCYSDLWLDYGSDWYEEGTLPFVKMRRYNFLAPEQADLDFGLSWLFGDAEAVSIDKVPNHEVSQSATTELEDTTSIKKSWLNDKLRLRLSATEFRDYVMLADPLAGLAAAPWQQPILVGPTSIPPHFPSSISRIIRHLPLFDVQTGHNFQKVFVDFINTTFAAENPKDMDILRRIGEFLTLGLPDTHKDIARTMVYMMRRVCRWTTGTTFTIADLLELHESLYLWTSQFYSWVKILPQREMEKALGFPVTVADINHAFYHLQVNVGDGIDFTMIMTECKGPFDSEIPSFELVKTFVDSLPTVNIDDLPDDDRACAICRGPYGEPGSMLNGDPEGAVKLPCSHVFGKLCLTVLLGPKPEGWGQKLCPLCRREVLLYPSMIPSGFQQ